MLTTGEILQRERQNKKLTVEQVEKETRIRKKNLTAVEENDWSHFPSKTYILGVIKSYGKFLGLDEEKLSAFFRREYEQKEDISFKQRVSKSYLTPEKRKVFFLVIGAIITSFVLYFGYQIKLYFTPPFVAIMTPKESVFHRQDKIELVGKTEKEAVVMVNGERVFQDKNNIFRIKIPLTKEKNDVIIEATGANGKKTILKKIFYKLK